MHPASHAPDPTASGDDAAAESRPDESPDVLPDDVREDATAEADAPARVVIEPGRMREALIAVAEPAVAAHRCELIDLEWRREPIGWVMRLYVEHLGHDPRLQIGGVGIDECARISRDVSMALDVADILSHQFHLEVSSPGLERPLTKPQHYRRFAGLRARFRLDRPLDGHPGRKAFRGELLGGDDASARVRDDEVGEVSIPFERIAKAALVYEPAPKVKPGKGKKSPSAKRPASPQDRAQTARASRDGGDSEQVDSEQER